LEGNRFRKKKRIFEKKNISAEGSREEDGANKLVQRGTKKVLKNSRDQEDGKLSAKKYSKKQGEREGRPRKT